MYILNLIKMANLAEARTAWKMLQPHLPTAQIIEQITCGEIAFPKIGPDPAALPMMEHPHSVMSQLNSLTVQRLPEHWKPAYLAHKLRMRRTAQLRRLHSTCWLSNPSELADVDGVTTGLLLLCLRPLPGTLRRALMDRALTHEWGAYFAARGIVLSDEEGPLLRRISENPRLSASLWRANPELAEPLVERALNRFDLWSAVPALQDAKADHWLVQLLSRATTNQVAAVTALTIQPSMQSDFKAACILRLLKGHSRNAYLAVRWARHTWPVNEWRNLRDQLRATAIGDRGSAWFHWYRDIEPEFMEVVLQGQSIEVLWQAELIELARNDGEVLRLRMQRKLQANGGDKEARHTLQWLNSRR